MTRTSIKYPRADFVPTAPVSHPDDALFLVIRPHPDRVHSKDATPACRGSCNQGRSQCATPGKCVLPHEESTGALLENQQFEDARNATGDLVDWMLIGAAAACAVVFGAYHLGRFLASISTGS